MDRICSIMALETARVLLSEAYMDVGQLILLIIPLAIIELGLMIFALVDLLKRDRVKGGRKWPWALLIVLAGIIGPIIYFILGRTEE